VANILSNCHACLSLLGCLLQKMILSTCWFAVPTTAESQALHIVCLHGKRLNDSTSIHYTAVLLFSMQQKTIQWWQYLQCSFITAHPQRKLTWFHTHDTQLVTSTRYLSSAIILLVSRLILCLFCLCKPKTKWNFLTPARKCLPPQIQNVPDLQHEMNKSTWQA